MTTEKFSLIDSHCHPHFPQLGGNITAVYQQMTAHQVSAALVVATKTSEWEIIRQLTTDYVNIFYAAIGIHPLAEASDTADEQTLIKACRSPQVIAVGETGLDFFRGKDNEAMQRQRFALHIAAAKQLNKPLIIHTRDSLAETLDMLRAENARNVGGVLHCFSGSYKDVVVARDINFIVSFSGIVTFKKSHDLRAIATAVDDDGYLVETDAPYLSPAPYRGKTNTPGYVRYVADAVAMARRQPIEKIAAATTENFNRLFNPPR